MTITYATAPFTFVDSQYGSSSNQNIKSLVNVAIDRRYHREVQKKLFFTRTGMIGPDTYTEGGPTETAPGYPVIRKTDLTKQPGDTIKMGLRKNLSFSVLSTGKTGSDQLVDNEVGPDFYNQLVKIERWRQAVRIDEGMNAQRNPYEPFDQMEMSLLSDWGAQVYDTSILYAANTRWSPHLLREYGTSNLVPTECPNLLIGNDTTYTTTNTVANLRGSGDDNVKGITFEIGATFMEQSDFDPVIINGQPYWLVLCSPRAIQVLYRDDEFRKSAQYARNRGDDNPLFRSAEFNYYNCLIYRYDKVRTILGGNNPAGLTVSGKAITEATYTGIGGGVAASSLHQTIFLGANALSVAEGRFTMGNRFRKEDDYGTITGRGIDNIYGCRRNEWTSEDTNTTTNQAMLKMINTLV